MMPKTSQIQLDIAEMQSGKFSCQLLIITLWKLGDLFLPIDAKADKPFQQRIELIELETLALPTQLHFHQGIILYGNAPIWLYARLVDQCQLYMGVTKI